jgi:hypothetical protein
MIEAAWKIWSSMCSAAQKVLGGVLIVVMVEVVVVVARLSWHLVCQCPEC